MFEAIQTWLLSHGLTDTTARVIGTAAAIAALLLILIAATVLSRKILVPVFEKIVSRTSTRWDDILVEKKFFSRLSTLVPVVIAYVLADVIFPEQAMISELVRRLSMVFFVIVGISTLDAFLQGARDIAAGHRLAQQKPVGGYFDAIKIIAYLFAGIFIVSILTDKSPWGVFSVLGGLTAVLLLIFKDTILGFVAGIQLSAHDMVRVGDWVEMPKFEADGDVIDVSIHTIKVRNWDKTITTIPTYAMVTNSFRNWRGMKESGGRRIKRSLFLDMTSIQFCTDEMLEKFSKFTLLREYLESRQQEIEAHNKEGQVDPSQLINGRRQTNIGVFRAYIVSYLKANPKIHKDMTFLVRQLQPTPQGLPMEIYVFSNDQVWANYEGIQADIFDHILAAVPEFGLRVFQYPSGHDLKTLTSGIMPSH